VLGTDVVHPLDMANAYATIAAGGVYHKPFIVREATYISGGAVAYAGATAAVPTFDADVIADTTYAMTQVVQKGSGKTYVKPLDRPIAGKTGTSSFNTSAWFIGFTPDIVTAVALSQTGENGKDQVTITPWGKSASGKPVGEITGGTWPAALWASYMKEVFKLPQYAEIKQFPERANVGKAEPTVIPTTEAPTETAPEVPEAPAQATVPSGLEGKLEADARASLVNAGLAVTVVQAESSDVASGHVISVSPGGGTQVAPGSAVTITVSTGPPAAPAPVPVPTETLPAAGPGAAAPGASAATP
jgi:membrane peptidoglycan carboxypeptidase